VFGPRRSSTKALRFTLRLKGAHAMIENAVEILLVEDNPNDVELTLHALRKNHISNRIHVVRDGVEALEFIFCTGAYAERNIQETLKVILLDLKLPKVDGLEVLQRIKEDRSGCPQRKEAPLSQRPFL